MNTMVIYLQGSITAGYLLTSSIIINFSKKALYYQLIHFYSLKLIRRADHVAPSIRKSWHKLRRQAAVVIVRYWTKATELLLVSYYSTVHKTQYKTPNYSYANMLSQECSYLFKTSFSVKSSGMWHYVRSLVMATSILEETSTSTF
jgi:hypothetical protein